MVAYLDCSAWWVSSGRGNLGGRKSLYGPTALTDLRGAVACVLDCLAWWVGSC